MEVRKGYVEHIVFRNNDNGYTVFQLVSEEEELTCVGLFSVLAEGELVQVSGYMKEHPLYGEQLQVEQYELLAPEDETAMEKYLKEARGKFVKENETESLFTNCSGKSMSRQGFWKVLKGYAEEAGIQHDITPHTLRHSFAAHMLQNGADVKSVQEMLGHSDISTTQVYLNFGVAKMRDVYMKAHPRH